MTLEELEVRFLADTAPFEAGMEALLAGIDGAAGSVQRLESIFRDGGANASRGLAQGVISRMGEVQQAARRIADAAAQAMRAALAIRSPSRVTMDMGRRLDEGLALGMQAQAPQVKNAARALSEWALPNLTPQSAPPALSAWEWPDLTPQNALPLPAAGLQPAAGEALTPKALGDALSALSITIPIQMDGYQLGLAAIEGINRVSSGTGRVEINL